MPHRVERTRAIIRLHAAIGARRKTPGKVPKQVRPDLIRKAYARELRALLGRDVFREAFAPLLEELPSLLASAARERVDSVELEAQRFDAGEGKRIRELVDQAANRLRQRITSSDIEALARRFAAQTSSHNRAQLNRQVKSALGVDAIFADPKVASLLEMFVHENAALITNIPQKVVADTSSLVMRAVQRGTLHGDLAKELDATFGFGERRAELIARDQVGKFYGQVNAARQLELGIRKFVWRTVKDERVRGDPDGKYPNADPSHHDREGVVYSYGDDPSAVNGDGPDRVDQDGTPSMPGEEILCRCNSEPYFGDILEGLDD